MNTAALCACCVFVLVLIVFVAVVVFFFRMRVQPGHLLTYRARRESFDGIGMIVAGIPLRDDDDLVVALRGRRRGFMRDTGLAQLVGAVVVFPESVPDVGRLRGRSAARRLIMVGEGEGLLACWEAAKMGRVDAVAGCPAGVVLTGEAPPCPVLLCLGNDDAAPPPRGKNVIVRRLGGRGWLRGATREILAFLGK